MTTPIVHFIGCGTVGQTLARLLSQTNSATIGGIMNRSLHASQAAINFIGSGTAYSTCHDLPPGDIYFITTSDNAIADMCEKLVHSEHFKEGSIVMHCSGALSSTVLKYDCQKHYFTLSVHPVKSFATAKSAINHFAGTPCGIEGDEQAIQRITPLFEHIGGQVFTLNPLTKPLYHAACVFANNFLTTLHKQAYDCFQLAGVKKEVAASITSKMMHDALDNLSKLDHKAALTGPIKRGDNATVEHHLTALTPYPHLHQLYQMLSELTSILNKPTT